VLQILCGIGAVVRVNRLLCGGGTLTALVISGGRKEDNGGHDNHQRAMPFMML
jgi:hypothetical protein